MISQFKSFLASQEVNVSGWTSKRHILVIESDDWGSIRMPSRDVYESMLKAGIRVDKCPYNKYDSLASEKDLQELFNVLIKFKDKNGNHPVITANTVVANPDFEKIKDSDFKEYHYEPFTETLKKYPKHQNAFKFWKQGITDGVFYPQFHGREHVNVDLWLKLLREKNQDYRKAFDHGFWGLGPSIIQYNSKINIQATFDASNSAELAFQKSNIEEGLSLFEKIFGFNSKSYIANNFIWDSSLNRILADNGVDLLQGMKYQLLPIFDHKKRHKIRHYIGDKNEYDQVYLIRNCSFEPTQFPYIDNVNNCLREISTAFFWRKPAIISIHRLNFIGYINHDNRDQNIKSFEHLLSGILKKWPDIEFMTSVSLGAVINNE